jgi:hypothetical protein
LRGDNSRTNCHYVKSYRNDKYVTQRNSLDTYFYVHTNVEFATSDSHRDETSHHANASTIYLAHAKTLSYYSLILTNPQSFTEGSLTCCY